MIIPPREFTNEDEKRLAGVLNECSEKMLAAVDAACKLRTAPSQSKRQRALMRSELEQAASRGMAAFAYSQTPEEGA